MRADDVMADKKPESEPARFGFLPAPAEGIKDEGEDLRRNRPSLVVDFKDNVLPLVAQADHDRCLWLPVRDRVRSEVGNDLRQPVGIPSAGEVPSKLTNKSSRHRMRKF